MNDMCKSSYLWVPVNTSAKNGVQTRSDILGDIVSSIVSIGISAFIVYYLYRPHAKAYFGKSIPK